MKAYSLLIAYLFIGTTLLLSFQNCAQEGFQVIEGISASVESASQGTSSVAAAQGRVELNGRINSILEMSVQSAPTLFNGVNAVSLQAKAQGLSASSDLIINAGEVVVIDASINVRTLTINGSLACDNTLSQNKIIQADTIYVNGVLECGANQNTRFNGNLAIKLKDNGSSTASRRGLVVNRGGVLRLFGNDSRAGMYRLSQHATAGSNVIAIDNTVAGKWAVGDSLVVGSTSYDLAETETFTVSQISADGRSITLDKPLRFAHWGTQQSFNGRTGPVLLDQRAEVANLTRNIRIMADETAGAISDQNGIGGHIMIAPGGAAYVDAIELFHMGQAGVMGRYPFHWHKSGDVNGQFFRNSSINSSFQRCLTVHSTQRALVQNNTCYNFRGHGYFLEEGDEIDNILIGNLAIYGLRPLADKILLDSDRGGSFDEQRASAMSGFWISHPYNTITGNVVSGTQGTGFWMSFITGDIANTNGNIINQNPIVLSGESIVPRPNRSATKDFSDNISHANVVGMNWDAAPGDKSANNPRNPDDKLLDMSHYFPPVTPTFRGLVNFKNIYTGIYFRGQTVIFENAIFADNGWSMFFAYNQIVRNSSVIGRSQNHGQRDDEFLYTVQKRFAPNKQHGIVLYDGPFELNNVNFLNFPTQQIIKNIDGQNYDVTPAVFGDIGGHRRYFNQVSGLHFSPEPYYRMFSGHGEWVREYKFTRGWYDVINSSHLRDLDGSLTGVPGSTVVPDGDVNTNSNCVAKSFSGNPSFAHYKICANSQRVQNLYLQGMTNGNKVPFVVIRSDGATSFPLDQPGIDVESSLSLLADVNSWTLNNKFNVITGFDYSVVFRPRDSQANLYSMPRMVVSLTTETNGEVSPLVRFVGLGRACHFLRGDIKVAKSVEELRGLNETSYFSSGNEMYFKIKSNAPSWQMASGGNSRQSVGDYEISCDPNSSPHVLGNIDGVSAGTAPAINGWACDQTRAQSIDVHLYVGGASGSGTFVGSYKANVNSENQVRSACGVYKGGYRFSIDLPESVRQVHGGKKIYLHGISTVGSANLLISGSGNFSVPTSTTTPPTPTSCAFNGGSLASGSSVVAYAQSSVPYGSSCQSQTRTCTNGSLSGSYTFASCTVGSAPEPTVTPVVTGYVDNVVNNVVYGWACDKGIAQSIDVHIYVGNAAGLPGAVFATAAKADIAAADNAAVRSACAVSSGAYRFNVMLPLGIREAHAGKKIYVHGISTSPNRANLTLANSGTMQVPAVGPNEVLGYVDGISTNRLINGWACNKGIASSIKVHIYAGGPAGSGTLVAEVTASQVSENAVRQACGVGSGQYRFSYQLPTSAAGKRIFVYGISVSGDNKHLDIHNSGAFVSP